MNTNFQSASTLFCDRRIDATAAVRTKPNVFSDEIEGEGAELFLRGCLVACLLVALGICNLSIGNGRHASAAQPGSPVVACAKPASAPAADETAKL